jgi:DNA-binding transcriptional LysR family regulator
MTYSLQELIPMIDLLTCIKSFVRTAETGSFSAVAREMNTTQPTISKQIAGLEAYLDVQLLRRSTRKMNLLATLAEAESSVGSRQVPHGILRVNCSVAFGQMQIVPRLKQFLDRYPTLQVALTLSDYYVDLVAEGIDVAIRIGHHRDPNLISEPIAMARFVTVGSTAYFEKFPAPQAPADLIDHNCIVYTRQSTRNIWQFQGTTVTVSGNLQVNDSAALREAVIAGIGSGTSPLWAFSDALANGSIEIILKNYEPAPLPIQAVYQRGTFQPAKVKCWIDFLLEEFDRELF